jgi:hypothetical protein
MYRLSFAHHSTLALRTHLKPLPRSLGIADLVLGIILLCEVLHDAAGFEEVDRLAIAEGVGQGRDAAVGVDSEEPGLFLGVFRDVDFVGLVGEAEGVSMLFEWRLRMR